jgi:hypothetical protein
MASLCPTCKQPFDPDEGSYTEDGLICGDCQDQRVLDGGEGAPEGGEYVQGSFGGGFAAGFFGGCIGYLLVNMLAKGEQTKKGARIGFFSGIAVGFLMRALAEL